MSGAQRNAIIPAGPRTRKWLLLSHIVSACGWIGMDVILAVYVGVALTTEDQLTRGVAYRALELLVAWPLTLTSVVCLVSGVLLGLTTSYGLLRFWWVVIKLALNVVLTTLVLILLRPEMTHLAEVGARLLRGEQVAASFADSLVYPPVVSLTLLVVASVLSVFKPWGRPRWARRAATVRTARVVRG